MLVPTTHSHNLHLVAKRIGTLTTKDRQKGHLLVTGMPLPCAFIGTSPSGCTYVHVCRLCKALKRSKMDEASNGELILTIHTSMQTLFKGRPTRGCTNVYAQCTCMTHVHADRHTCTLFCKAQLYRPVLSSRDTQVSLQERRCVCPSQLHLAGRGQVHVYL